MDTRRSFLSKTAAAATLGLIPGGYGPLYGRPVRNRQNPRILPERLKEGDLIGLVTPGSPIEKEELEETVQKLETLGFRTYYEDSVLSQFGYFAGEDKERAGELMHMFTHPEVNGIWSVRGGYGSIRILNYLDFDRIRENPKVFIGYSDITALLTSIYEQTGLVTYHGPLGISEFNEFTVESLSKVVMDPDDSYRYPYFRQPGSLADPVFDRYTIHPGKAEGELTGGNISVLDSMTGSRYEPDFSQRIVYLEEIEEKTYRVDKMLYHLLEATNLSRAAGILLGVLFDCDENDPPSFTLREAVGNLLHPLGIPVSYGLTFGHIDHMITLPNGIRARLNADRNTLRLLERPVR